MNRNLPPLTSVIAPGPEAGFEFERLMKKLLIKDSAIYNYEFDPGATIQDGGIDGYVKNGYHQLPSPVVFQFKFISGPIDKGHNADSIKKSLNALRRSEKPCQTYILCTPENVSDKEKKWLENTACHLLHQGVEVRHYGQTRIDALLDQHPILKKYYYGIEMDGDRRSSGDLENCCRRAIIEENKHISFIGLNTGGYQRQQQLERPELEKIYIPLDFIRRKDNKTLTLQDVLAQYKRVVALGDPGGGKSTMARYIACLFARDSGGNRIPWVIPVRKFVQKWHDKKGELDVIDYLVHVASRQYQCNGINRDFFLARLEMGKMIVVFDGLDETATESARSNISRLIQHFANIYEDAPIWITSRKVGYTVNVRLDHQTYEHFELAPVTLEQADDFISAWCAIQYPLNQETRENRILSLQKAIRENKGVRRLRENPLLLTMMMLVHMFEGDLPDDRAKLYDRCILLLLENWQQLKDEDSGAENPLRVRNMDADEQMRLLGGAAFYIQDQNPHPEESTGRGLISESQLMKVLTDLRFDERRSTLAAAQGDIRVFLAYIRERTGLLVETGLDEFNENVFSFVHLSFQEYLSAWFLAQNNEKTARDKIPGLISRIGTSSWEEPILLSLYLLSRSGGRGKFLDLFCREAFQHLEASGGGDGWLLMGRAVRDNLDFADDDIRRICREVSSVWILEEENTEAMKVLKEIAGFSKAGRIRLEETLREMIRTWNVAGAFSFVYLYKELFGMAEPLRESLWNNPNWDRLGACLPVFRHETLIRDQVLDRLSASQWKLYYNSLSDSGAEMVNRLTTADLAGDEEISGYMAVAWRAIVEFFQNRGRFYRNNQDMPGISFMNGLTLHFGESITSEYPVDWNWPHPDRWGLEPSDIIQNERWRKEADAMGSSQKNNLTGLWLEDYFQGFASAWAPELTDGEKNDLRNIITHFQKEMVPYFNHSINWDRSRYLNWDFSRELHIGSLWELVHRSVRELSLSIGMNLLSDMDRDLTRNFRLDAGWALNRRLSRDLCGDLNARRLFISEPETGNVVEKSAKGGAGEEKSILTHLTPMLRRYDDGRKTLVGEIVDSLFNEYIIENLSVEYRSKAESGNMPPSGEYPRIITAGDKKEPFLLALLWEYLWRTLTVHYAQLCLTWLKAEIPDFRKFRGSEFIKVFNTFMRSAPFSFYFLNFAWNYYSQAFNARYDLNDPANAGVLGAFVSSAARTVLVAHQPCRGEAWEKTLAATETSSDLRVKVSLFFYRLCVRQDPQSDGKNLDELLRRLKIEDPVFFNLAGIILREK